VITKVADNIWKFEIFSRIVSQDAEGLEQSKYPDRLTLQFRVDDVGNVIAYRLFKKYSTTTHVFCQQLVHIIKTAHKNIDDFWDILIEDEFHPVDCTIT
jgi:hypothetical protein